ncbi:MAG TPA: NAD+ synthase [Thermoplasmata archaeon]|nr:NAD+ synthase [Thermoplasmata archaeon]
MSALLPRLPAHARSTIEIFLRAHALGDGRDGVVVGLSGGIDSAVTARLARDALGPAHVLGVMMPDAAFPSALLAETADYARTLGIEVRTVPIDPIERAFAQAVPGGTDVVSVGNTKARIRMVIAYSIARQHRRLVAGTGNKSELLLGYFTKYGDGGVDLLPIGDLYKTEVRALAAELGLPEAIRSRPPTAGLWEGQTDEAELGAPYEVVDRVLKGLEELRSEAEIVAATGIDPARVRDIARRLADSRHKRRPPPIPKVGLRTVGIDWRE